MPDNPQHQCEMLAYDDRVLELAYPGTPHQRWFLKSADNVVLHQIVFFCPFCGLDCRKDALWEIPGRPLFNDIVRRARESAVLRSNMKTREEIQIDIESAKSARESMRRVAEAAGWDEANAGFIDRCNDRIQALSKEMEDLDKPAPPPQAETPTRFHREPVI